jgi:eukaryotic-like serine/threonine-protein kinase
VTVDGARFRRLMDLVAHAAELPPEEADGWLTLTCGSDLEMLEEARSLMEGARTDSGDGFTRHLEAEIARQAADVLDEATPLPSRIGPYRVLEVLGEGGMGIVYAARQEEPIRRDVAVKVVRAGAHAPKLVARFESERQTLASLDHPNIARVLDAGSTEEGLPYVAMEWVRGRPITEFCDERGMGLQERLRLFRKVLGGVQHAHQKAVVHRDLKPSNVLVTEVDGTPVPKVIDFGVARVTSEAMAAGPARTAVGTMIGTLEYMSPEQATSPGEGVDTRSDIYSLGVMLYELLTGVLPYPGDALRRASPGELERLLRDTDPPTASRRVSSGAHRSETLLSDPSMEPARLARALRGDLDNILGRALRKDPAERYASAAEFSEDLGRYLAGHPVRARPSTLGYRARRFVGRHTAGVVGTAVAVVLLVAVTGAFTARLASERDRARLEAATAEQVSAFLQQLFELSDPSESLGETVTVREILDTGAETVGRGLSQQPEVQARMMRVIGQAFQGLGLWDRARPLLEGALERHLALHGPDHADVATSQANLGSLLMDLGDLDEAEDLHRTSLETRTSLLGAGHPRVVESLGGLAEVLERKGDLTRAEELYREALSRGLRSLDARDPQVSSLQVELGRMLRLQGQFEEAEPLLRAGLAAQRSHYGDRHPRLASGLRHMASLLRDRGEYEEAGDLYREALVVRRRALGDEHPDLAVTLSSYAILLQQMGDREGAITALTEAVDILEGAHSEPHPNMAHAYSNLAIQLGNSGREEEAGAWFRKAVEVHEATLPSGHPDRAHPILGLAWIEMNAGRPARAEPLFRAALEIRRTALAPDHRDLGGALSDLGACLAAQGRYAEAEPMLVEAHDILSASEGRSGRRASRAARRLAEMYQEWGRPGDAERYLEASGSP